MLEERGGCLFRLCSSTLCHDAVLMKQKVEEREEPHVVRDVADGGPHCSVMKEKCTMLMRNYSEETSPIWFPRVSRRVTCTCYRRLCFSDYA
jgi:hypothetical protein